MVCEYGAYKVLKNGWWTLEGDIWRVPWEEWSVALGIFGFLDLRSLSIGTQIEPDSV